MHHTGSLEARGGLQKLSLRIQRVLGSANSQENENASHGYPGGQGRSAKAEFEDLRRFRKRQIPGERKGLTQVPWRH